MPLPAEQFAERSGSGISRRREAALLIGLLVYAGAVWIWGAGRLDITSSMESSRALVARAMMRSGDYVVPRRGDALYLAKPPLFDWAATLTSRLWGGVSAASVRLVSALSAMALLLVVYFAARPAFGWATAFVAAGTLATSPNMLGSATSGRVDMLLALGVAVSLFGAYHMLEPARRRSFYAAACGIGLGMGLMTKGPVVLTFFVPTVLLYLGFRRGGRLAGDWRVWAPYLGAAALLVWLGQFASARAGTIGTAVYVLPTAMVLCFALSGGKLGVGAWRWGIVLAVAVALAAPWPVLAVRRLTLGPLLDALHAQAWQTRITQVGASNYRPIWFYAVAIPVAALPYSMFAALAFAPGRQDAAAERKRRLMLFARCWLAGAVVFYTFASAAKDVRYLLPAWPPLCLLAADVMVRGMNGDLRPWMNRYVRRLAAAVPYALCFLPFAAVAGWFGLKLPLSGWLAAVVAVTAGGAALSLYLHRVRRAPWAGLSAMAAGVLGLAVYAHFGQSVAENRDHSARPMCEEIRGRVPAGATLYLAGATSTDVLFYLDPVPLGATKSGELGLDGLDHAYVCVEPGSWKSLKLPAGYRAEEIYRAERRKGALLLLRLERAP
jgi:4-amino-4-deoxy-L-arabinose transferase-like glycosyltransferase